MCDVVVLDVELFKFFSPITYYDGMTDVFGIKDASFKLKYDGDSGDK